MGLNSVTALEFLTPAALAECSDELAPFLARIVARSGGRLDVSGLRAAIDAGAYWVAVARSDHIEGVLLVKRIQWNTGLLEIEFVGLAGESHHHWIDHESNFAAKARQLGFHVIGGLMRPGLARALKARGWRVTHVYAEKVLSHASI